MAKENLNKDSVAELDRILRTETEKANRIQKEKDQLTMAIASLEEEIQKKTDNINELAKNLNTGTKFKRDDRTAMDNSKQAMLALEEQILQCFSNIQKLSNLNYKEKYKKRHIDQLVLMQKDLKVTYIIIKKLDIKEEFYLNAKVVESPNPFENLKNLAKAGHLNYRALRPCGPILIFRVTADSKFSELKQKCCQLWGISENSYSLYDDSFNNLECWNNGNIQEFFAMFQPLDSTIPKGQACFYLMEKLKLQHGMLDTQARAIDSRTDVSEDNQVKGSHYGNDIDNCINLIIEGKILKGLNNFKHEKIDKKSYFYQMAKMADNNIIFILATIMLIIVSFYSISAKKDVYSWNVGNYENLVYLNSTRSNFSEKETMYEYLQYLTSFTNMNNPMKNAMGLLFYGPVSYRFMKVKNQTCTGVDDNGSSFYSVFLQMTNLKCYYSDHVGDNRNLSGIVSSLYNFSYDFSENLNISHEISTPIGQTDTSGTVIEFWPDDYTDYEIKNRHLQQIISTYNTEKLLGYSVQSIELTFSFYDPFMDIFISNLVFVERDINLTPTITRFDSVPFITNVYELFSGQSCEIADIIRLILTYFLISSIFCRIVQKYLDRNRKERGFLQFLKISITVLLQLKNILLLFSAGFISAAFANYKLSSFSTNDYYSQRFHIDLYYFANMQKEARSLDQIAMYLICIYSLKYIQFIPSCQSLFVALKKSAFEFFSLLVAIGMLFVGLSILTSYVFGSYIYEYKNFLDSLVMNLKIFLFIENTSATQHFLNYSRDFAIIIMVVFIFLIRYFLLNLFFPILIEYYRIEVDREQTTKMSKIEGDKIEDDDMSSKEKLVVFLFSCCCKKKEEEENEKNRERVKVKIENDQI